MIDPATIKAVLGGGGGAAVPIVVMFMWFTPADTFNRHVAEASRGYILDLVEQSRGEPDGAFKDSLCRALREAVSELCAGAPDDAICLDREIHLERAGCR